MGAGVDQARKYGGARQVGHLAVPGRCGGRYQPDDGVVLDEYQGTGRDTLHRGSARDTLRTAEREVRSISAHTFALLHCTYPPFRLKWHGATEFSGAVAVDLSELVMAIRRHELRRDRDGVRPARSLL